MTRTVVATGRNWTLIWPVTAWHTLTPAEREAVVEQQRQLLEGANDEEGVRREAKERDWWPRPDRCCHRSGD